jgi:hypothetical protein
MAGVIVPEEIPARCRHDVAKVRELAETGVV